MGKRPSISGSHSGYGNDYERTNEGFFRSEREKDNSDLIIEGNAVYEIDRDCIERLKRQKKRKLSDNKRF